MPDIEEFTDNKGYPLPNPANIASNDADRLAAAITQIDADMAAAEADIATKSEVGHGHGIGDVSGLQTALDSKSGTGHTHPLDGLSDVNVAGAPVGRFLKKNSTEWAAGEVEIEDVVDLPEALDDKVDYDNTSIVIPRGTTVQRPTVGAGASRLRFNTDLGTFEGWDGAKWGAIGGGATIAETPPSPAQHGMLWWSNALGAMFIYYDDGTSAQWVSTNAGTDPSLLLFKNNNLSELTNKADARSNLGVKWATIHDQKVTGAAVFGTVVNLLGYELFKITCLIAPNAAAADFFLYWRGSLDGVTFDSGAGAYSYSGFSHSGVGIANVTNTPNTFGKMSETIDSASNFFPPEVEAIFFRGSGSLRPRMRSRGTEFSGTDRTQSFLISDRAALISYSHLMIASNVALAFAEGSRFIVEAA